MRILVDEDLNSNLLVTLLQKAGHDVLSPTTAGTLGKSDAVQLTHAIREQRVCLSQNYEDFAELSLLVAEAKGRHFGMLIVRLENDPTRDLTPKGIVAAIRKFEATGAPTENEYVVLNYYR